MKNVQGDFLRSTLEFQIIINIIPIIKQKTIDLDIDYPKIYFHDFQIELHDVVRSQDELGDFGNSD